MDNNQFIAMMEQYWQEGKDFSALYHDCMALATAGKTPLGLNQWVKSDKPLMEDFNEDNRIIDAELQKKADAKKGHQWFDLPLLNGEYRQIAGMEPQYSKDAFGVVRLRGYLLHKDGSGVKPQITFAQLPAGFRPSGTAVLPVAISRYNAVDVFAMNVATSGEMFLPNSLDTPTYQGGGISLMGISFWAGEQ